jgi:hypothetical protein
MQDYTRVCVESGTRALPSCSSNSARLEPDTSATVRGARTLEQGKITIPMRI